MTGIGAAMVWGEPATGATPLKPMCSASAVCCVFWISPMKFAPELCPVAKTWALSTQWSCTKSSYMALTPAMSLP